MHFTKRRRDPIGDLTSTVQIGTRDIEAEKISLRVLGVWVDPKLTWKEHVKKAVGKATAAYNSLARITASTWGPSARRSKLLYSAVVRPTMMYGSQVWGFKGEESELSKKILKPLKAAQNRCLRRVMGAYKRTPTAALEKEAEVLPLSLYTRKIALQRAEKTAAHPVENSIAEALDRIWKSASRKDVRGSCPRPPGGRERIRKHAADKVTEARARIRRLAEAQPLQGGRRNPRRGHYQIPSPDLALCQGVEHEWQTEWEILAQNKQASTWRTPWAIKTMELYDSLTKAEATALFLL